MGWHATATRRAAIASQGDSGDKRDKRPGCPAWRRGLGGQMGQNPRRGLSLSPSASLPARRGFDASPGQHRAVSLRPGRHVIMDPSIWA